MGVNNWDLSPSGTAYVTAEHATSWGDEVVAVADWVNNEGWGGDVDVWGGMDAELAFNSGQATRTWALNFSNAADDFYLDFGACENCTSCNTPGQSMGPFPPNFPYEWTCEERYDVAWGEPNTYPTTGMPMPEIYNTGGGNATQWYTLSLLGHQNYSQGQPGTPGYVDGAIGFIGALTQSNACQEVGCQAGTNNDPNTGFDQLYSALLADPRTVPRNNPYPFMVWSSDMSWEK